MRSRLQPMKADMTAFSQHDIDMIRAALDLVERHLEKQGHINYSQEIIAARVVACATAGERDPARLALAVLLGDQPPAMTH